MTSNESPFKSFHNTFHQGYKKQRNAQLERELVLAQTKLRYLLQHVASNIVPLPPEAGFLSATEKHNIRREVASMYDRNIDKFVANEKQKTPHSPCDQIRLEITNGMIYYMFYYVINLQSEIDPSLL